MKNDVEVKNEKREAKFLTEIKNNKGKKWQTILWVLIGIIFGYHLF